MDDDESASVGFYWPKCDGGPEEWRETYDVATWKIVFFQKEAVPSIVERQEHVEDV